MSGIVFYSTIPIEADSSGYAVGQFSDISSIQADSVRIYNSSANEVFVSFGSSDGIEAAATLNSFPVPPKMHVNLHKGAGSDQVSAITENGKSKIRCTAIETSEGDNAMGVLQLVAAIKDAIGNPKAIDAAADKIARANDLSEDKKKEAKEAAKTIAEAKKAMEILVNEKARHEANMLALAALSAKKDSEIAAMQDDLDSQKLSNEKANKEQMDIIEQMLAKAENRHGEADIREQEIAAKGKKVGEAEIALTQDKASHEAEKKQLVADKEKFSNEIAAHEAKKKKLAEAIG